MSSERPKKPVQPRAVVESVRKAIHDPPTDPTLDPEVEAQVAAYRRRLMQTPPDSFEDGVRAEKHLREHACPNGESPFGPFVPPPEDDPADRRNVVWFSQPWRGHIRRMTPAHLDAVYAMSSQRIRRDMLFGMGRGVGRWLLWAIGLSFAAMHWFSDQVAYFVEKAPALKAGWALFKSILGGQP